jgi:hypothetical protein
MEIVEVWEYRAIRDDTKGSTPEKPASILETLKLNSDAWYKKVDSL